MEQYIFRPVGLVHSPFTEPPGTPVQPAGATDVPGTVVVDEIFLPGLKDLDGFSHIFLLYVFHRAGSPCLTVKPYLDTEERGIFATRAPRRPNPIGLSLVRLVGCEGNVLHITGVDLLDGTPLLDIKPYIPQLNPMGNVAIGWLTGRTEGFATVRAPAKVEGNDAER